jgi:hypothetical protein
MGRFDGRIEYDHVETKEAHWIMFVHYSPRGVWQCHGTVMLRTKNGGQGWTPFFLAKRNWNRGKTSERPYVCSIIMMPITTSQRACGYSYSIHVSCGTHGVVGKLHILVQWCRSSLCCQVGVLDENGTRGTSTYPTGPSIHTGSRDHESPISRRFPCTRIIFRVSAFDFYGVGWLLVWLER